LEIKKFADYRNKIVNSVSKAIVGKERVIELVLNSFVCSGHVLLEDVPGTGKTMLLRALPSPSAAISAVSSSHPICCPPTSPA